MNKKSENMNIRAHETINDIGFPHRIINLIVLENVLSCLKEIQNIDYIRPRVLDVGCGTGYLLKKMLDRDLDAWGLDPYPRGGAAEEWLSKRVIVGSIQDVPREPFQVITAVEVLEHVEDYMKLLKSMISLLSPDGYIIVTVPNNWKFRTTYSPDGAMEPMYGHLWQFDHKSLESDLKCFSNEVYIKQIYSGNLDRRMFKFTRVLPSTVAMKLSKILLHYYHDGGWLLGVTRMSKSSNSRHNNSMLQDPSARYFKNSPLFQ